MPERPYTVCADDGALLPLPGAYTMMTNARRAALVAARETGAAMVVCVRGRPRLVVLPDGRAKSPPGMKTAPRTNCTAGDGEGACFCVACRADRKRR